MCVLFRSCYWVDRYLNTHIRADKKNHLLLRAPMRPSDKELIRDAGRQKDEHAPRMLRLKMSREGVYVSHPSSALNTAAVRKEASGSQTRRTASTSADPLPESRQIEDGPQESTDVGQEPRGTSTMNRAERRRHQQEQKKAAKRRK